MIFQISPRPSVPGIWNVGLGIWNLELGTRNLKDLSLKTWASPSR